MKKNGASHALLSPGATGWRVRVAGAEENTVPSLNEALAAIPAHAHIELALPCQSVLLERHKLPATDRAEIADMLQLQLEKTLPFPVDEMSHGYELLDQTDSESTILSIAAHHTQLDRLCAPLREQGRLPERITLEAQRVAAACPAGETVLVLWPEQEQLTAAIVANGKLAWAQPLTSRDAETVLTELPGQLISAELDGVPVDFTSVYLARDCADLEPALTEHFEQPIHPLPETAATAAGLDLLPTSWQYEAKRQERNEKLKQNLLLGAVCYLVLVAGAFVFLAWHRKQAQKAQEEVRQKSPQYTQIAQQQTRWSTFAPAVEPSRYPVEVLLELWKDWKQDDSVQFTGFNYSPAQWILSCEGVSSDAQFTFTQTIKKNETLKAAFQIETPNYQPLKEDRVAFKVTGKPLPPKTLTLAPAAPAGPKLR